MTVPLVMEVMGFAKALNPSYRAVRSTLAPDRNSRSSQKITQNILGNWEKIGPGPLTLSTVPQTTDLWQATVGAIAVAFVAFGYQLSPLGRLGSFRYASQSSTSTARVRPLAGSMTLGM